MRPFVRPARSGYRVLALVLALGALVVLAIATAMTAQAFVTKVGETTLDDFATGEFHRTGLLDIPPDIDSVQLLPIGLFGEWKLNPQSLPFRLTELAATAAGGHLVVMGGSDNALNWHDEVHVATVGSKGLLDPWVEQETYPLPHAVAGAAAVAYPKDATSSWVYLLGGRPKLGLVYDDVYRTTLDHNTGTIGPWLSTTEPLSVPAYYLDAVALNGYLYVIGGYTEELPLRYALTDVYYAAILADGDLGPWQAAEFLPEPLSSHLAVAYSEGGNNTLYVIGGWSRTGGPANSSYRVYFADVNPDGSLSAWQLSQGNLPAQIYAHSGVMVSDQILVTGGRDASNTISNTVKAALVDPGNPTFRLYDWCLGVPPPTCTVGAWESGPLLPQPRAFHVTVASGSYVYTLGGVGPDGNPTNSVYYGSVDEPGALYSPWGSYLSSHFDFNRPVVVRRLEWDTTIAWPGQMTMALRYRYKPQGGDWQPWSAPINSSDGLNQRNLTPPIANARLFQYRIDMTTNISTSSPLLNWVEVYYELEDPDLSVRKDTGAVITVPAGSELEYTIYFSNTGGWVAENAVLTETLPEHTSYAGDPAWQRVGTSNRYTYALGQLAPGAEGNVKFLVEVDEEVPEDTSRITNTCQIHYPPMIDALGQTIVDPTPGGNSCEFSNPVSRYVVSIGKDAVPPPGSIVYPGEIITYTLTYTNGVWGIPATNACIVDTLPDYTSPILESIQGTGAIGEVAEGQLRWCVGTIPPGQVDTLSFSVVVGSPPVGSAVLTNTAIITSSVGPTKTSNSVIHFLNYCPVFEIDKDAVPPPGSEVEPGSLITYTIYYENAGLAHVNQAVLTDNYDLNRSYQVVSIDPPPSGGTPGVESFWNRSPLAPGDHGQIQIVVQLSDTLPNNWNVTNQASIRSLGSSCPQYSDAVTHKVVHPPEVPFADLTVTDMRWVPDDPAPNTPIDFYATIENLGTLDVVPPKHFWTELYIRPMPSQPPSGPSDHDYGYCLNNCTVVRGNYLYYESQLLSGESKEAWFKGTDLILPSSGTYQVCVQIDVAFYGDSPYWGRYAEDNEYNNMLCEIIGGDGPRIYLPLVRRSWP